MKTDKEQHFYDQMWSFWTPIGAEVPPCIKCYKEAVTLHEIRPRSLYPDWMDDPYNSVPICARCHNWAESNHNVTAILLTSLCVERLHAVADWKGSRMIREF